MKKLLCIALSLIFVLCGIPLSAYAEELPENEVVGNILVSQQPSEDYSLENGVYSFDGEKILNIWKEFEEKFPDRTNCTENEKAAANYLASTLENCGLSPKNGSYLQSFSVFSDDGDGSGHLSYSQNVVGIKAASTETKKTVVIGAHYDNAYGLSDSLSKGAYDNGSGVAVLLALAKAIYSANLPFNVEIVFFGMEETGTYGSLEYVASLSEEEKQNILMMINVDSISCGDYLYLFSDEIPRTHESIFFDSAEKTSSELTKMPKDKKTNGYFKITDNKPFVHVGLQSDNVSFLDEEIPCVFFFGYNLSSTENINGQESDGKVDIMHTENDNVESVLSIYGEEFVSSRFAAVADIIATTLSRSDFVETAEYSKAHPTVMNFIYSTWFFFVVVGVTFALFILAVFLKIKKDGNKLPAVGIIVRVGEKEPPTFEEEKDEDVFD